MALRPVGATGRSPLLPDRLIALVDSGKHRWLYRSFDLLYHKILAALLPHQPHGFAC